MMLKRFLSPTANAPAQENPPQHVAIIMDGNGRWAKQRGLPRIAGHKKGAEALRGLLGISRDLGIRYLTVYAFSFENWQRPKDEVNDLMQLLKLYLSNELGTLIENRIRLHVIGDREKLPVDIQKKIEEAEAETASFDDLHLSVCLSYGARQEIVRAARMLAERCASGDIDPSSITDDLFGRMMFTSNMPDPDLLIRTSGEQRLSNFLLWQSAYTELYFTDVLWPDFTPEHLREACRDYATRERRYGKA